jgi:hypothetical protein
MATSFYSGSGLTTTEQDSIESSIAAAEAAKAAAEAAKVAAETAETNAETAEVNSETAKVASEAAQASAETAEANALASSSSASTSATQSAASATSSASSAASASSSSSSSASSAASASTAQTASETAQAAAEAALDDFTDAYLGAKTSDPSLDNDNNALIDGALYFNTTDNVIKVYDLGTTSWTAIALSASDSTNLATVSGQISPTNNLATVAGDSADISTVAGISSDVSTVAADTTDIGTVAGISANVTTVAGISSDVTTVAADATDIGTVAGISANVTTVAGDSTNIGTVATNISNVNAVAGNATSINTVAADGTDIGTVAGISSDISTVAADGADIGTVAGISSDVTTVASISANTTTVAGISSDVTSVAGVSSDVTTVAGISSNVTTVAGDSTDIQTVASNITGVNSFADRYQVGTTNPTTSLDAGDLFFNTTDDELKVYNGSAWSTGVTTGNATQSSDGLMSSADKTKLDGVEASADVTDTTNVVAALTGGTNITIANDGTISASGGDITVQDEGSSLATAATALNFTGTGVTASGTGSTKTINITDTNTTYSNATTSAAGLMSSSDKTKIDGIASGATNVTNTNQLTNGAGFITSADGGNAATLDSIDSTSFLRSDADDSYAGKLTVNGHAFRDDSNTERNLRIQPTASNTTVGLSHFLGNGNHGYQLYASNTDYGFLDSNWGGWDIKKTKNGVLEVDEGSGLVKVWTAGNDGSGSGLDADTLDGNHASAFLTAHPIISNQGSSNNSGNVFIQDVIIDSNGHVIGCNTATASAGGSGAGYVDVATGDYGTIKVDDDRSVTYAGYAIRDDWVLMSNGTGNCGIYNDTDNEWGLLCRQNAEVELYHNGSVKMETTSGGAATTGTHTASTFSGSASVDAPVVVASTELRTDRIEGYTSSADSIVFNATSISFSPNGNTRMNLTDDGKLQLGNQVGATAGVINIDQASNANYIQFTENGSGNFRGKLGESSNDLYITGINSGIRFDWNTTRIVGCSTTGGGRDNYHDLGYSSARWDDIYATNGTIVTSDEREKQQIASLTSAEITTATAISKLFKTFKWNDKVASKGDDARIHSGVIAQEVKTVMADAGLDAAKYAFWCENIWWEVEGEDGTIDKTYETEEEAPEGSVKKERMGIRYPELLAFIGAATEQRLSNIETRLTALEG